MAGWPKPLCVSIVLMSLVLLSISVALQPRPKSFSDDLFLQQVKECDTDVAKIPSLIMFPAKGTPVVKLLSDHDIDWASGGSMQHTIAVPAVDAERARQLIFNHFPDVDVIWLDRSRD